MNNRTLIYLTGFVIIGMLVLLALNMTSILTRQPESQAYLKFNDVRGMAINHNQLLYTLNFNQQNKVIEILNRSVRVVGVNPGKRQKPDFEKMIVYQFEGKPDLVINPIAYVDKNLVFSVPEWDPSGYLMELSEGDLQDLLSKSYD
jgi:hypothetical protein